MSKVWELLPLIPLPTPHLSQGPGPCEMGTGNQGRVLAGSEAFEWGWGAWGHLRPGIDFVPHHRCRAHEHFRKSLLGQGGGNGAVGGQWPPRCVGPAWCNISRARLWWKERRMRGVRAGRGGGGSVPAMDPVWEAQHGVHTFSGHLGVCGARDTVMGWTSGAQLACAGIAWTFCSRDLSHFVGCSLWVGDQARCPAQTCPALPRAGLGPKLGQ